MPPSNYFASSVFDDNIFNEKAIEKNDLLLESESLLDFANNLNFAKISLDFHYRSQHPDLINFSNFAFYQSSLVPLPNTINETPIRYFNIEGSFINRVNKQEAEKVIDILENEVQFQNENVPSIGVATFSITQRDFIIKNILNYRLENESFNEKMNALELAGFFVKNLENIQGDERDIIIISTTYGKNEEGKFRENFGPINQQKGYKLLNVIVSRAKQKLFVCTSIPEDKILSFSNLLASTKENNKKGILYAYLAYAKAVSEQNESLKDTVLQYLAENQRTVFNIYKDEADTFDIFIADFLKTKFPDLTVKTCQYFGGFKIDILVEANIDNRKPLAIECDGTDFFSENEAYLAEIHHQEILERYGFSFHRIWSTNWWENAEDAKQNLEKFIISWLNDFVEE